MDLYDTLRSKPLAQLTDAEMAAARELAHRILQAAYYAAVRALAADLRAAIAAGRLRTEDEINQHLDEAVGASAWAFAERARETLLVSNHRDEFEEATGAAPVNLEERASYALKADVREQLSAEAPDSGPDVAR